MNNLSTHGKLYKYRNFNLYTLRMLTNGTIFFSNPLNFNDPLDCSPEVSIDVDISSLESLLLDMSPEAINVMRQYQGYNQSNNESIIAQYVNVLKDCIRGALRDKVREKGVFSLAGTWNSPLMWSHYGDEHKGICIEYDVSKCVIRPPQEVDYEGTRCIKTSTLIEWLKGSDSAKATVDHTSFFTKAHDWQYEQEWRLLSDKHGEESIPFPISAVYFGMNCDHAIVTTVINLMQSLPLQFFQLYPREDTFVFERRLLTSEYQQSCKPSPPLRVIFGSLPPGASLTVG